MFEVQQRIEAVVDDPSSTARYRTSAQSPYPDTISSLPPEIIPRQITLRDRVTAATLVPFSSHLQVPLSLLSYLCDQLNREIERGDTYPMTEPMSLVAMSNYWFANLGAVMILGDLQSVQSMLSEEASEKDWNKYCLGSFYIKPNYPGRSSHVCSGGFLVTDASRNRGVGRLMGEGYLDWAPKLGYTYSVFNLVYETNMASTRIWDALGFKRIGRVPGCGSLRSHPDRLVDAIIYGRALGGESEEEFVSEDRFDKIRYYLKHNKYPAGADRAEKSRLRSAAMHYRLLASEDGDGVEGAVPRVEKLMLKGKEVIGDPQRQYEIAKSVHVESHAGINKMTKTIAQKYHWTRIKETVSLIISNCPGCKDFGKLASAADGALDVPTELDTQYGFTMQGVEEAAMDTTAVERHIDEVSQVMTTHGERFPRTEYADFDQYNTTLSSPTVDPRLTHQNNTSSSFTSTSTSTPNQDRSHSSAEINIDIAMTVDSHASNDTNEPLHHEVEDHQSNNRVPHYKTMDAKRAAMAAREALRGLAGG